MITAVIKLNTDLIINKIHLRNNNGILFLYMYIIIFNIVYFILFISTWKWNHQLF